MEKTSCWGRVEEGASVGPAKDLYISGICSGLVSDFFTRDKLRNRSMNKVHEGVTSAFNLYDWIKVQRILSA